MRMNAIQQRAARFGLLLPATVILALSVVWPVWSIFTRSLNDTGRTGIGQETYVGHYVAIFQDDLLWSVTVHSVMIAVVSTAVTVCLAFPAAYVISRLRRSLSSLMMVLMLLPFWVSIIIRLFAFTTLLGTYGTINWIASNFGLGPYPLLYNTFSTVVGMVAYLLPYLVLIMVSAMMSVDGSLLTAARTMGASERRVFFEIYFPQVRPALLGGTVIIFVLGLGFFLTPAILGGPKNLTIPMFIQQQIDTYQWGEAAAMGIALLVVSVVGYLLALRIGGKGVLTPTKGGSRGVVAEEPLRLTPVTFVCMAVLAFDIVLLIGPLVIVIPTAFTETTLVQFPPVGFTLKWFGEVVNSELWIDAFSKSVVVGIFTAFVATLSGMGLARVATSTSSAVVRVTIQVIAIVPLIIPVILLAIGIYDVQGRMGLLGTDLGLVIAHAVLCLPFTFLMLSNALSSVDIEIEQAAWTMGAGRVRAFRSVVFPNVTPAVVGSLVIAFVTSWDEAVLALFQTGLDKTLPVTIYSFLKSGVTPSVSAVATIVTVPVIIGCAVIGFRAVWAARGSSTK